MKKTMLVLFLPVLLISCSKSNNSSCDSTLTCTGFAYVNASGDYSGDVPNEALTFTTHLSFDNFSSAQEAKVNQAAELVRKVIASREFKDAIINFTYNGVRSFVDNGGNTNEEVYQRILDGAETLQPILNNAMDVELQLYTDSSTVIGYTFADSPRIWMNTKYFDTYTPVQISDNLTHEWLHKLGFTHADTWSDSRDHSVPYAIGYLVESLAGKYYTP
jgi:hypothetical protein